MALYNISCSAVQVHGKYEVGPCEPTTPAMLFRIGFGDQAQNDAIVREVTGRMDELKANMSGKVALVNGPASLPVAVIIGHRLAHMFGCVGIYDPKLAGYVVSLSHGGVYPVGAVIPQAQVQEEELANGNPPPKNE